MSSQVDGHDEERELRSFGYEQQLSRSMGVFSSLSISISRMCITAGIFTVYAYALSTAGPAFVWTWPVVAAGQILVALVLAELAGRLPLSGYAFQWTSRLASSHYELTLRGSYHHTPATIREALALLAGGAYPFAELLTHTYPLERVAQPLAQAAGLTDPDDQLLKAVIRP
jgi:amino acid transporter